MTRVRITDDVFEEKGKLFEKYTIGDAELVKVRLRSNTATEIQEHIRTADGSFAYMLAKKVRTVKAEEKGFVYLSMQIISKEYIPFRRS